MTEKPSQTISFSGNGNNVQFGENSKQEIDQTFGEAGVTLPKFIDRVVESVPEEIQPVIKPLMARLADLPEDQQRQAIEQESPEWVGLVSQIQPHAASIWKNVATFGAAALQTFAERQPLVAGIMAVCEANKA